MVMQAAVSSQLRPRFTKVHSEFPGWPHTLQFLPHPLELKSETFIRARSESYR